MVEEIRREIEAEVGAEVELDVLMETELKAAEGDSNQRTVASMMKKMMEEVNCSEKMWRTCAELMTSVHYMENDVQELHERLREMSRRIGEQRRRATIPYVMLRENE